VRYFATAMTGELHHLLMTQSLIGKGLPAQQPDEMGTRAALATNSSLISDGCASPFSSPRSNAISSGCWAGGHPLQMGTGGGRRGALFCHGDDRRTASSADDAIGCPAARNTPPAPAGRPPAAASLRRASRWNPRPVVAEGVWIIPGLKIEQDGDFNVMRGEETQLLGACRWCSSPVIAVAK
jgi:hypothetical protein